MLDDDIEAIFGPQGSSAIVTDNPFPYEYYLTVGDLRRYLSEHADLPDAAPVLIQRVEDVYFEKHGWKSVGVQWAGEPEGHPWEYFQPWGLRLFEGMLFIDAHY